MVVTVVAVWVMQMSIHQIINMVAMRHRRVSATRAVNVIRRVCCTLMCGCASIRIFGAHFNHVFIHMVTMHMVQVAVMQIIYVIVMLDSDMATVFSVLVRVIGVLMTRFGHGTSSFNRIGFV
jgi:hypothetical protein